MEMLKLKLTAGNGNVEVDTAIWWKKEGVHSLPFKPIADMNVSFPIHFPFPPNYVKGFECVILSFLLFFNSFPFHCGKPLLLLPIM